MSRLIDLSQEIYQGMQVYPGHLKTVVWEHVSHAETAKNFEGGFSFQSMGLMMNDHGPTHVDAISHLDPSDQAPSIDEMDLETFYGPATCVDLSFKEPHSYISADEIEAAVRQASVEVNAGDTLLLYTGTYDRVYGMEEYTREYPGLDESASEWLREKGVKAFGVDSPSPDNPISKTYPVHMMCRATGITHYENLANLDKLVGKRFTFAGFPLKVRGGTGSPIRAVAILDE
jgi:kynurenine formamidase